MYRAIPLERGFHVRPKPVLPSSAKFSSTSQSLHDTRLEDYGRIIKDDFAKLRHDYSCPRNPIVLAHGLFGFDELRLVGNNFPSIHYWRGIREAFALKGIEVITTTVSASASIEQRAAMLAEGIESKAQGKCVNIIAHSMGGLDSRHMISRLKPKNVKVASLTTIATPHRGSSVADFIFDRINPDRIGRIYRVLERTGISTDAFSQLTRTYMRERFNPNTPDVECVRYFSYGASLDPTFWSIFWLTHRIIMDLEGAPNDGLVSVPSSQWGEYKGTLSDVSHLDLINWTNRVKLLYGRLVGITPKFNAIALYLSIADMLAKEGL